MQVVYKNRSRTLCRRRHGSWSTERRVEVFDDRLSHSLLSPRFNTLVFYSRRLEDYIVFTTESWRSDAVFFGIVKVNTENPTRESLRSTGRYSSGSVHLFGADP